MEKALVLYQDESVVAVFKPEGMLVHRGMRAQAHEQFLLQQIRNQIGAMLYPVHRLDRPTRGIVIFALSSQAARSLQESWKSGQVKKTYHAVVRGWLSEGEGLRDEALDDPDSGILHEAQTRWKVLEQLELPFAQGKHATTRLSLLELEPITGRYHQLRRHLSRMHYPIIGDTTHGDRHHNHLFDKQLGWWELLLWASAMQFPHPLTKEPVLIELPLNLGHLTHWEALKKLSLDT